jgi:hypothetical protein
MMNAAQTDENDDLSVNDVRNHINAQLRDVNGGISKVETHLKVAIEMLIGDLNSALTRLNISAGRGRCSIPAEGLIYRKGIKIDQLSMALHEQKTARDTLEGVKVEVKQLKLVAPTSVIEENVKEA